LCSTDEIVCAADVVFTMGCGDACPVHPGKRYEDWELTDPRGQPIELVRQVRDDIKARLQALMQASISRWTLDAAGARRAARACFSVTCARASWPGPGGPKPRDLSTC